MGNLKTTRTIRDTKYVHYVDSYKNYFKVGDTVACFIPKFYFGARKHWDFERIRTNPDLNADEWGITKEKAMSNENFVGFYKVKSVEDCKFTGAYRPENADWTRVELDHKEINF